MVAYGKASWELRDKSDLVMSVIIDDDHINGVISLWKQDIGPETVEELVVIGIAKLEEYKRLMRTSMSYPKGEEVEYTDENRYRTTNEEKRYLDNSNGDFLSDYRQAAETHRQVRQWAQKSIKPGQSLIEIANGIENSVRQLTGHDGLSEGDSLIAGMGFPLGLNLDDIAAHFSPNAGDKTILQRNNVMKVDIGVHVNGRIVDSAFTMSWDPTYDNLIAAVKDATNTGIHEAGIDVRLGELGGLIQETMESYECEINGVNYPIRPIRGLSGHNILRYSIHGAKSVPSVLTDDPTKMEEGDVFAIETFGSYTAQFEHGIKTILLRPTVKEVITRGDDY
ncbi:unnamed protein product [Parascedosporium putredinis]|uniref:Peptidase M24 domain-containing protein n=1 Tax=Parascedosporium putredinis TaxID=1442378 RepID=A0A9P1MCE7_9PEZI|nr:unnamed protein product [Parascedosporium putredinis]CAI7996399.1 unnamed protein product [Parascedosporium putredinis]